MLSPLPFIFAWAVLQTEGSKISKREPLAGIQSAGAESERSAKKDAFGMWQSLNDAEEKLLPKEHVALALSAWNKFWKARSVFAFATSEYSQAESPAAKPESEEMDASGEPKRFLGLSKACWAVIAAVFAMLTFIFCIQFTLQIVKRRRPPRMPDA
eukprot:TRINITY_DN8528_c0_g1_i1.p1 TRINITY_DN8528_c0_g1~~TRINITY_DN8528_c0_g1_i1.p1  ORF type:complete len:156 (+),score=28.89 TRINITY_DN8528_c0_g1_i1:123-590(+)